MARVRVIFAKLSVRSIEHIDHSIGLAKTSISIETQGETEQYLTPLCVFYRVRRNGYISLPVRSMFIWEGSLSMYF